MPASTYPCLLSEWGICCETVNIHTLTVIKFCCCYCMFLSGKPKRIFSPFISLHNITVEESDQSTVSRKGWTGIRDCCVICQAPAEFGGTVRAVHCLGANREEKPSFPPWGKTEGWLPFAFRIVEPLRLKKATKTTWCNHQHKFAHCEFGAAS